jgi:hypothetical protein
MRISLADSRLWPVATLTIIGPSDPIEYAASPENQSYAELALWYGCVGWRILEKSGG